MEPGIYEVQYKTKVPAWMPRFFAFYEGETKETTLYQLLVRYEDKFFLMRPPMSGALQKPISDVTTSDFMGPVSEKVAGELEKIAPLEVLADTLPLHIQIE